MAAHTRVRGRIQAQRYYSRPLFDRGFLVPPAVKTWPLENSAEAYQAVLDGSAGIKQVLLPAGGAA
jgi:hypothetical protein